MKAPLGFAHYQESCREILGHNADIVSIEMRKEGAGDVRVVMFFRSGDVVHAAGSLLPDEAHKIAVQLTLALAELREDLGNGLNSPGSGTLVRAEMAID